MGSINISINAETAEELQGFLKALMSGIEFQQSVNALDEISRTPRSEMRTEAPPATPVEEPAQAVAEEPTQAAAAEPAQEAKAEPAQAAAEPEKRKPGRPPKSKLKEELEESLKAREEAKTNGDATAAEAPQEEAPAAAAREEPAPQPKAKPAEKLTRESISQAMNNYIGAFGSAAALTDFKTLCSELFGTDKLSQIPDEGENFSKMIGAIDSAIATNRFGRKAI
jgi:hypothetical protein